jgi:hypothetical protein
MPASSSNRRRNEDPLFGGGERQQLLAGDTVELTLLVCWANVVAVLAERVGNAP